MRTRISLLFCLLLGLTMAGHRVVAQFSLVPRDYPTLYYKFVWNDNVQLWDSANRYFCTYDVNGRLLTQEQHNLSSGGVWNKAQLTEAYYTAQPDSTVTSNYYWDGSSWVKSSRTISVKDSLGRVTHDLTYQGSTAWVLHSGSRFTFIPDLNGNLADLLIENYDMQANDWDTSQSVHLIYSAGNTPDTILHDFYSNGLWFPVSRDVDIQWQNFNRFKASYYIRQYWSNNQYINGDRVNCAFGPYEYRRCTTDAWDASMWVPDLRDKHLQDSSGHLTDTGSEYYNGTSWQVNSWVHYDHTYSGGKLAESIAQYLSNSTQQLTPWFKYVFVDHTVESTPPAEGSPLIAFPMPARDRLYVRADLRGPLRLRVYDLQGRLLLTQDSDADRLQASGIDISQVPNGLYLLQIEAARTHHTVRIQVQH